jgi:hypothetical protein
MDHGDAEFDLSAVDEDFLKTIQFMVDLFMHDARMGKILNEYHGSIPDLAAEMREMYLRLGLPDCGDYACVMAASIAASYAEDVQMKSA